MSPTTRVGESDPNRGTAPEAISPGRYAGRVAVVTGAGSGIGRATARRLAAEGAAVACLDLAEDAIAAVAAEINQEAADAGGRAIDVPCDVTDESAVARATDASTADSSVTSQGTSIALPPASAASWLISAATAAIASSVTSRQATAAPSAARRRAAARPIPDPAPVTTATLPA